MRDGKLDCVVGIDNVAHELAMVVKRAVISATRGGIVATSCAPPRVLVRPSMRVRLGHSVPVRELRGQVCRRILLLLRLIAIALLAHGRLIQVVVNGEDLLLLLCLAGL